MSAHIPFDIQVLVIERLPSKSLIRFRSVCKAWKSLIGSSQFIAGYNVGHDQLEHHLLVSYAVEDWKKPKVKYVCFVDDDTFPQQKFSLTVPPLVQELNGYRIIGSSHGLLCLTGYFLEPDVSSRTQMAVLWNPAIRKSIAVVVPNVVWNPAIRKSMADVWNPAINYALGFGVCPETKDPKLVKITYNAYYEDRNQVMVFTLSLGKWRCLCSNQLPRKSIQHGNSCPTTIGHFIYWIAWDMSGLHNVLLAFDLSTDEFSEVHLPDSLRKGYLTLSRLRESLVLVGYYIIFPTKKTICDVWMMDHGDSKEFTKLFTINLPNASVSGTLAFKKSGEPIVEIQEDIMDPISNLALYEPRLEDIYDLGICGNNSSFFGNSYMISLLLLDHDDHGQIVRCGDVNR